MRSDVRGIGLLEARGPASSSPACLARAAGPGPAPISFPARRFMSSRGVIVLEKDQAVRGLGDGESGNEPPSHQIDHNLQSKLHAYDLPADSRARRASAVEDPARADAPYLGGTTHPAAARRQSFTLAQGPPSHADKMTPSGLGRGGGGGSGAATGGGGRGADGSRPVCAECVSVWGAPGEGVVRSGVMCVGGCAGAVGGGSDEQSESDARMCAAAP